MDPWFKAPSVLQTTPTYFDALSPELLRIIVTLVVRNQNLPKQRARCMFQLLSPEGAVSDAAVASFGHIVESDVVRDSDSNDNGGVALSIQSHADFEVLESIARLLGNSLHTITFYRSSITARYSNIIAAHCGCVKNLCVRAGRLYLSASQLESIFAAGCGSLQNVTLDLDYVDGSHIGAIAKHLNSWRELRLHVSHAYKCSFSPLWAAIERADCSLKTVRVSLPAESIVGMGEGEMKNNFDVDFKLFVNGVNFRQTLVQQ